MEFGAPNYKQFFDLSGRTALIVGAARGIGRESAIGLAAFGARIIAADIERAGTDETSRMVTDMGGRAMSAYVDIADSGAIKALVGRSGIPDILVVTSSISARSELTRMDEDVFDRVIDINLKGTFRLLRAFGEGMAARGSGSVIAFSSIRAEVVEPGQGAYAASKAGVLQLVRTLAAELGQSGVRVNAIAPGPVETAFTEKIRSDDEWREAYAAKTILGRWAKPEEIVGAVVFLASAASSYVTGSHLVVDGGWTAADGRFNPKLP